MKNLIIVTLALGLGSPAFGEEPKLDEKASAPVVSSDTVKAPAFSIREIVVGLESADPDTASSRFREYREVPNGVYLPYARFAGQTDTLRYDLRAVNVLQDDAAYRLVLDPGSFRLSGEYVKIPHLFGNDGRSLLTNTAAGVFRTPDTIQQSLQDAVARQFATSRTGVNYLFLRGLVDPLFAASADIDLGLLRERGRAELRLTKDQPLDLRVTYFHEKRRGDRAVGTSFGFGNVVETPEPIEYRTQDIGASAEYETRWGRLHAGFNYNWFTNNIPFHEWDNPFRVISTTDASAYTAPASGSIGGPSFGRASLPPNNSAVTGQVGFAAKFAGRTRLSASVGIGQWKQDETLFIPYTTNAAISMPALPANKLDGKIDTTTFNVNFSTRPATGLSFNARYRRYDLDNQIEELHFPGYVRFDGVFEDIPRKTVPYGYSNDKLDLTVSYVLDRVTLEAGYRYDKMDRLFRETERTTLNQWSGKLDLRAADWAVLRGSVEFGSRDYDGLDIILSEEESFQEPGAPANLLAVPTSAAGFGGICPGGGVCNLRYDQAAKDVRRYGMHLVLTPGGTATVTASYLYGKDDYKENLFSLIAVKNQTLSLDVDYTPNECFNVFGYYTREKLNDLQGGRQSGATVSINPLDNWTSDVEDEVDTFGLGGTFNLVKDKLDLKLNGSYQKVDGNNDLTSPPGGTPDVAVGIALYDDTKLWTAGAEFAYRVTRAVRLGLGGWYEKYEIDDAQTQGLLNYVPGSFFLNPIDSDYKATVLYVRASYVW
jgi:MtrB/PioB family decaheme-associated outer membrane protein